MPHLAAPLNRSCGPLVNLQPQAGRGGKTRDHARSAQHADSTARRVGSGVVIFARFPVCTDLLTVGSGTIIRENCSALGYRAEAGVIQTGSITLRHS